MMSYLVKTSPVVAYGRGREEENGGWGKRSTHQLQVLVKMKKAKYISIYGCMVSNC